MVKEKSKGNRSCGKCGITLKDEDAFHHMGMNYCRECVQDHIEHEAHASPAALRHEDSTLDEVQQARDSPEGKRAWTYDHK